MALGSLSFGEGWVKDFKNTFFHNTSHTLPK